MQCHDEQLKVFYKLDHREVSLYDKVKVAIRMIILFQSGKTNISLNFVYSSNRLEQQKVVCICGYVIHQVFIFLENVHDPFQVSHG